MPLDLKFVLHVVVTSNLLLEGHVRKQVSSPLKILEVQGFASSSFSRVYTQELYKIIS
jgi:hypothetical protein